MSTTNKIVVRTLNSYDSISNDCYFAIDAYSNEDTLPVSYTHLTLPTNSRV